MKLGILGTGKIVKDLLSTIHVLPFTSLSIMGVPELEDETRELAARYDINHVWFDYQDMLNSDVDTIYVALPNHLHYSFASEALQHGKHVIIEKPITIHMHELQALKDIAEENNLIILEAMNIHYLPSYLSLKHEIDKIGAIKLVTLNYSQYSSRYKDFLAGTIHPAFDALKGGGALMDINIYNIHFVVGLFGEPITTNYFANIQRDIDTSGIMVLDYGDFKCTCIGAKDCKAPANSTIQGENGSIKIALPVNQMLGYDLIMNDGKTASYDFNDKKHRLSYEFQEFIRIIDNLDFETANKSLKISTTSFEIIENSLKK